MRFCTKCVMPDTKPDLHFDEDGVCDACRSQEAKDFHIDWNARKEEFLDVVKKHKKNKYYDCIIGVSGGKDSTFQVVSVHIAIIETGRSGGPGFVAQYGIGMAHDPSSRPMAPRDGGTPGRRAGPQRDAALPAAWSGLAGRRFRPAAGFRPAGG